MTDTAPSRPDPGADRFTGRLVDGAMRAIDEAGFAPTVEERRAFATKAVIATLHNLADEIDKADEDDVIWPEGDDLRILAGELEDEED